MKGAAKYAQNPRFGLLPRGFVGDKRWSDGKRRRAACAAVFLFSFNFQGGCRAESCCKTSTVFEVFEGDRAGRFRGTCAKSFAPFAMSFHGRGASHAMRLDIRNPRIAIAYALFGTVLPAARLRVSCIIPDDSINARTEDCIAV